MNFFWNYALVSYKFELWQFMKFCQSYAKIIRFCLSYVKAFKFYQVMLKVSSCFKLCQTYAQVFPKSFNCVELCRFIEFGLIMPKSSSYIELCQTCEFLPNLCQSYWVMSNYAHLWKISKITPIFSSFAKVFAKLSNFVLLCQTYQNFVEVMPKLSNCVKLCRFIKFCTSYAINYEVYWNFAKVI